MQMPSRRLCKIVGEYLRLAAAGYKQEVENGNISVDQLPDSFCLSLFTYAEVLESNDELVKQLLIRFSDAELKREIDHQVGAYQWNVYGAGLVARPESGSTKSKRITKRIKAIIKEN